MSRSHNGGEEKDLIATPIPRKRRVYTRWDIGSPIGLSRPNEPIQLDLEPAQPHPQARRLFDRPDSTLVKDISPWDHAKEPFSAWIKGFNLLILGQGMSDQAKLALLMRKLPRGRQLQLKMIADRSLRQGLMKL